MRFKKLTQNATSYLILILACIVCFFPFLWMLSSSLKQEPKLFLFPPEWIPHPIQWSNYIKVFETMPMHRYLFNSFKITLIVLVCCAFVASMAGYAFTKLNFPFRNALFLLPLCSMMIPNETICIPLFKIWSTLGATNTHIPLIITNIVGSDGMFGVFLMRQFYLSIPTELCEAAKIDGCSPFRTYLYIFLPLSGTAIATLAIHSFVHTWNDFFSPLIYLNDAKKYTVPLGLSLYADSQNVSWSILMAASVVATLPLMIGFFCAQRKFMESMTMTGMKT